MASRKLLRIIQAEAASSVEELDEETLDNILIEPHQDALAEAIAADVIDVVPLLGDLSAIVRNQRAADEGIEYPESPAYLENALGDIPKPVDTIADVVISQNVMLYLQRNYGLSFADDLTEFNESLAKTAGDIVEDITPE